MTRTPEDTADALYRTILRRAPSPAEIQKLKQQLEAGRDVVDIAVALANSPGGARYRTPTFVPPGHFYSPIVDPERVSYRDPAALRGEAAVFADLDLDIQRMTAFWVEALAPHAARVPFPAQPAGSTRYHFENPAYGYGDAITLNAILLHARPRRIIEVGCGWSSACILDTIFADTGPGSEVTFIEPFPELLEKNLRSGDRERVRIIPSPVQDVPISVFQQLAANDVLFIDSTHVVKTGSDVVYELCEILPRLNPGVLIHFHDIFYPFEYPRHWVLEQNRSWNEIYALRNFLAFNSAFEVIFFNDMFVQFKRPLLQEQCPQFLKNSGGSIWLRRRVNSQ
jgi:hypothetical protein